VVSDGPITRSAGFRQGFRGFKINSLGDLKRMELE
jgi:hypothetical protein